MRVSDTWQRRACMDETQSSKGSSSQNNLNRASGVGRCKLLNAGAGMQRPALSSQCRQTCTSLLQRVSSTCTLKTNMRYFGHSSNSDSPPPSTVAQSFRNLTKNPGRKEKLHSEWQPHALVVTSKKQHYTSTEPTPRAATEQENKLARLIIRSLENSRE